jgi:hypothetical protein
MEAIMNPDYEFLTHQYKQMISQPRLSIAIDKDRNRNSGIRGIFFNRMGDVLISGGIRLKKLSKSQYNGRSVAI